MADFLTRLAGRTLGLAPTVQPILAPMYAPGQQLVGMENSQQGIGDAGDAINRAPTEDGQAGIRGREIPLQERIPDEPPPGELVGQGVRWQEIPPSLVAQGNQPAIVQTHRETPGVQAVPGQSTSLERVEVESSPGQMSVLRPASFEDRTATRGDLSMEQDQDSGLQPRRAMEVWESAGGHDRQATTGVPAPARNGGHYLSPGQREDAQASPSYPAPLLPLQGTQGNLPVGISLISPIADVLASKGPREPKGIRPQQDSNQVGRLGHPYKRVDQREVAPATQEPSAQVPTIQVTIGRIEVRATPPPASRPQPRSSEPAVVGLEEYLNQRAKGGY